MAKDDVDEINRLIEHGNVSAAQDSIRKSSADTLNQTGSIGKTPIETALENERLDSVTEIINKSPSSISKKDIHGNNPLHTSLKSNSSRSTNFALNIGADSEVSNHSGQRPQEIKPESELSQEVSKKSSSREPKSWQEKLQERELEKLQKSQDTNDRSR